MVSLPTTLALSAAASLLIQHVTAMSIDKNPVTIGATVLNANSPVYGGRPAENMAQTVVYEDPTLSRAEVRGENATSNSSRDDVVAKVTSGDSNKTVSDTKRKLEITSADVQKLEEHFQQPMVVNYATIQNDYRASEMKPSPWPSSYWPTYQDGINAQWDGSNPSAAEKYAKAFGLNVKSFMDTVSRTNGIDSQKKYSPSCSSDAQCAGRNDGSVCAKRVGKATGYCVPTWYGICHAWAPAAILEPEPRCNVVKNGVTFKPFDIKGLLSEIYDGAYVPVVFTGARYDGAGSTRDEYGRYTDAKERDLGPGFFHIAVTNIMGRFKKSFVVDVNADAQVWNQPVRSYSIKESKVMTPAEAATKYFRVAKYPFNEDAISVANVRMTFSFINELVQDGPLVETGIINTVTVNRDYKYLLELDANQKIIGGEWLAGSQTDHPDFLWFATEKPQADVVTAVGLSYKNVSDLLQQSVACTSLAPTTTTPSPTTPSTTPTSPAPTTPAPTTIAPVTTTPLPTTIRPATTTTPSSTTPAPTTTSPPTPGGQCGNDQVGPQACPAGEYCQPWNPTFYQCRKLDAKCGIQETGVDYYGDDIATFPLLLPEDCCAKCASTAGCKAYTFINYNPDGKAYCYLKKGAGQKTNKVGAVSATIATATPPTTPSPTTPTPSPTTKPPTTNLVPAASGSQCGNQQVGPQPCPAGEYCQPWDPSYYQCRKLPAVCGIQEVSVDYYGDDIATFQLLLPEQCCEKCTATAGCKAYTFVNYNPDGKAYCYLKKGTGQKSNKVGVVSATIVPRPATCTTPAWGSCGNAAAGFSCCPSGFYCQPWDSNNYQCMQSPAKCSQQFPNTDFYGDDIATVYGVNAGECCEKCAATAGCKTYTYINDNVPTPACYLKKGTGSQRANAHAVSGFAFVS